MAPLRTQGLEFKLMKSLVENLCGLTLQEEKTYLVETRLSSVAEAEGCRSYSELYQRARNGPEEERIRSAIVDAITTRETFWFRDPKQFDFLREVAFPQMRREIQAGTRQAITIWSAACSSGQEPYSLAMTALDHYRDCANESLCAAQVHVLATDIAPGACAAARAGVYDEASLRRGLPETHRSRYFEETEGVWRLRQRVRDLVMVRPLNLLDMPAAPGPFGIIFLRNVIIYFSEENKKKLFARLVRSLEPGGLLFLGTGETVSGYTDAFATEHHGEVVLYRKK